MRACILSVPRSGSQYCERSIASTVTNITVLGEYFEGWNHNQYEVNDGTLSVTKLVSIVNPFSITEKYLERLSLLEQANATQNFTIRLFLSSNYDLNILSEILCSLRDMNFKFVNLHRNFRDIAISYSIAHNAQHYGNPVWFANSTLNAPIHVDIEQTKPLIDFIHSAYNEKEQLLSTMPVSYENINYETIEEDVTRLFGKPSYTGIKTITGDLSQYVTNLEDFNNFIDSYQSGL